MTAISILHAIVASAANPLNTDAGPAISIPALESGFRGQLDEAIQAWTKVETKDAKPETKDAKPETKDPKQGNASDDKAREPAAKDEDRPQLPALVAVVAALLPAPPPASIGLPAIGLEPGSSNGSTPDRTQAAPNLEPAAEPAAKLSINPPAPPVEAAQPDPKADLSFAMRLVSLIPEREAQPKADTPKQMQPTPRPEIHPQIEPAPAQLPEPLTETPNAGPVPTAPLSRPGLEVQPDRITTAPPQSAVPAVHRAAQQDNPSADSEPRQSGGRASEREPAVQPAKPAPLPGPGDTPPEIDLKPLHESGAIAAAPNSGHREIPLPTAVPLQTAAVSPSTTQAPAPAASAPAVEHVAAPPASHPTSEVTDVSVTLPVPRADSAGEDRVAIRMVQKGAEIHVSVRTPDHQLSQTMRQDIGRLAAGLDEAGFRTESWRPVAPGVAASSQSSLSHEFSQGAPNRDTAGSGARSGGREGRSPGEQKRRQPDERPRWVLELEQHKNQ